ncbi:MAG: hypothetical protein ACP5KW_11025 [Thermoproteota archaeon]|jgi:hypothetical protein
MNKNELIKIVKEKGPAFALGIATGAILVVLIEKRAAIKKALDEKVKQLTGRE